jgi:imidazoleglycerol phosphate synthase cyclase subunit
MITKRIIACLDVRDGRVVKGVQFVDIIDAGDPATQAARHAREGADEIVLLDITATHEGRATLLDTVRRTARELFVPFCVGGGIRSADDAAQVFEAGADKVSVNSAALADPMLIDAIGRSFGAQAVVVAIDARRDPKLPIRCAMRRCMCRAGANHGPPRRRVGARGRRSRRGRDSAHFDGLRWHARGLRLRADRGGQRGGRHSRDRLGRRGNRRPFCRCLRARQGRCGAGGQHLSLRRFERAFAQRRAGQGRRFREASMLIPSIDLLGGRIVQLVQGEKLRLLLTILNTGSRNFRALSAGAVDRPGRSHAPGRELSVLVAQIAKRLPVQAGGGIHSVERARQVLDAGAKRVIIGSALFSAEGNVNTEFAAVSSRRRRRRARRGRHRHQERPHRREGLEGAGGAHARRGDSATRSPTPPHSSTRMWTAKG